MGTVLHRIRGVHGDAVMDVAFNPLHPQLATACSRWKDPLLQRHSLNHLQQTYCFLRVNGLLCVL
jgi:hypothetical protein